MRAMSESFWRPESLLVHEKFLRRLLRGILRDSHAVDDVVQGTWVRALHRAPGDKGGVRQWLASVAKNLALDHLRGNRRRRRKESLAARPEHAPSPADILERESLCRELFDAVQALPELYRAPLLLRYYDGLSPRRIAHLLQRPSGTVRSQLSRGLELLRRGLDQRHGGDRRAWMVPLLELFRGLPPPPSLIGGIVTMTATSKACLAVGVLVTAGLAIWLLSADPPVEPSDTSTTATAGDRVSSSTAMAGSPMPAPSEVLERALVEGRDLIRVGGTVREMNGGYLSGARIRAAVHAGHRPEGEVLLQRELVANEEGAFRWELGPLMEISTLVVEPADPNEASGRDLRLLVPDEGDVVDLDLQWSLLHSRVSGRVIDEFGALIPRASVAVTNGPAVDTTEGRFDLPIPIGLVELHVSSQGYVPSVVRLDCEQAGAALERDVFLRRGFVIRGTVRDGNGQPIHGARVAPSPWFGGSGEGVRTDQDGRYEIGTLDSGTMAYVLRASHPGYVTQDVGVNRKEPVRDFELRRGLGVRGMVFGPDGRRLRGVRVHLLPAQVDRERPDAVSDEQGHFTLSTPQTRLMVHGRDEDLNGDRIGVYKPGFALAVVEPAADMRVRLQAAVPLDGAVVDERGDPIAGARVELAAGKQGDLVEPARVFRVRTGADGTYAFPEAPEAAALIWGSKAGYRTGSLQLGDSSGPHRLILHRAALLAGRVVDSATMEPLREFQVHVIQDEGSRIDNYLFARDMNETSLVFRSEDGTWSSFGHDIGVGPFTVVATADGYAPSAISGVVSGAADREIVLSLDRSAGVRGRVVSADTRQPMAGVVVKALPDTESPSIGTYGINRFATVTDPEGRFGLEGLPSGPVYLRAELSAAKKVSGPHHLRAGGGPAEVEIGIKLGVILRGTLLTDGSFTLPVQIEMERVSSEGLAVLETRTDESGSFTVEGVPPGRYRITPLVSVRGHTVRAFTHMVDVEPGRDLDLVIDPREGRGTASVAVTVICKDGEGLDIRVVLQREDGNLWELFCEGEPRRAVFADLPDGEYTVRASAWDRIGRRSFSGSTRCEVSAGEDKSVQVELSVRK